METPIAIVGMGVSGRAGHRLLKSRGISDSDLITFDEKADSVDYRDPEKLFRERNPRTLVVSPGYPIHSPWIQAFRARGGKITSELALGLEELAGERLVCVTGSLGKSTVVSLLGTAVQTDFPNAFFGGNLGLPLADYASDLREGKRQARAEWVVLELSSFQLENCGKLAPEIAAITFLAPNHLERHANLEEYYGIKWSLAERATRAVYLNKNGGDLQRYAVGKPVSAPISWTSRRHLPYAAADLARARMIGLHNLDNLALAAAIALDCGWSERALHAMLDFPGLPHRMQNLGEHAGATFVNDSKATTIESVLTAIESALGSHSGRVVVLLGGKDKNLPWEKLSPLKAQDRLEFIFFGSSADLIPARSGLPGAGFSSLEAAAQALPSIVRIGDLVLLSPGGTSLDEFKNFEERGRMFESWIKEKF